MNKQSPVWQKVVGLLLLSAVLIVIPFVWPGKVSSGIWGLSVMLSFLFLREALGQLDPGSDKTLFSQWIGRYTSPRDRFVASGALAVLVLVLYVPSILIGDMREINWVVELSIFVVSVVFAVGAYFAIGFYFGSQELRETITPKILKRFLGKRNQDVE